MFVPSKKESSVRRKTGLVKPWPSERSSTSTDKKNPVFEGVSSARDDFLALTSNYLNIQVARFGTSFLMWNFMNI